MTTHGPSALHILAGTDFSDGALVALVEARALADRLRLELRVMHVRERHPRGEESPQSRMRRHLADAGVDAACLRLREGQPWIELAREAGEQGASALVVGSHGRSGSHPINLGSTTVKLGLIAPCPLLVVGRRASSHALARVRWPNAAVSHPTITGG